ncbi:unnamed protein product [Phaeothamnion confervicola]
MHLRRFRDSEAYRRALKEFSDPHCLPTVAETIDVFGLSGAFLAAANPSMRSSIPTWNAGIGNDTCDDAAMLSAAGGGGSDGGGGRPSGAGSGVAPRHRGWRRSSTPLAEAVPERDGKARENARRSQLLGQLSGRGDDISCWSLEDVLEAGGCCVHGRGAFNAFCQDMGIYQFLTSEYVDFLASYVLERYGGTAAQPAPVTLLEVGAGTGRLSHFLRQRLRAVDPALPAAGSGGGGSAFASSSKAAINVVATDLGLGERWGLRGSGIGSRAAKFPVEKVSYQRALRKHKPQLVLCAWMPMDDDWTAAFRRTPSVCEYVLVGETDDGCCGHNWLTWGNPAFSARVKPKRGSAEGVAAAAGQLPYWPFQRTDLVAAGVQLSRYDCEAYSGNSRTVSFRRPGH